LKSPTLRRDLETDGRRAVVQFTDDWEEDAARRDFHDERALL
jgi:poly(A) polymerase